MDYDICTGNGFDVHAYDTGDHVILCGIKIPHTKSLKGHSDADVAMHALTDAIFGALADGDIGSHFPPSDMQWKGADSSLFLQKAIDLIKENNGRLMHCDITIICEKPKLGAYREQMKTRLSEITGLTKHRIGVKATTSEKLGFCGREEGIAAMASATIALPLYGNDNE